MVELGHDDDNQEERNEAEEAATTAPASTASTIEQRARWRQRALWLAHLGLAPGEDAPVEVVEEVANAALSLLDENERLRDDLAEQRVVERQPRAEEGDQ